MGSWTFFSRSALAVATLVWLVLGTVRGLAPAALIVVAVVPAVLLESHRRIASRPGPIRRFVFHRHVLVNVVVLVPLLAATGELSWRLLGTATAATLAGLAVGRIGCLRSGCCIGRESTIGARYGWFGPHVRHFPVQLLDATLCVLLAATTVAVGASVAAPWAATAAGAGGYLLARALLDELRDERVRTRRLTEAQRLAVAVIACCALAGVIALVQT
ncbi:MAG: prolipoprotein diacylglyceryl transferase family protein [Solirubrobacteraceae bacterium]